MAEEKIIGRRKPIELIIQICYSWPMTLSFTFLRLLQSNKNNQNLEILLGDNSIFVCESQSISEALISQYIQMQSEAVSVNGKTDLLHKG